MKYNNTSELLVYILDCVLNSEKAEIDINTDVSSLMKLAATHNVTGMVSSALLESDLENTHELFEHNMLLCYIGEAQSIEIDSLRQIFNDNKISYMLMKGVVLKNLYPQSYMRQMGDIDLYIKPADFEKAEAVLETEGYTITKTPTHHDEASNGRYSNLEIHRYLVGQSIPLFRKYYEDGWSFAKITDGYEYSMTNEDYYVYMVAHAAKHFINGGIGIRFVTDVYVFLNKYGDILDRTYIDKELDKLGILIFTQRLENLSKYWFGNVEKDDVCEELGEYIINCGVFGTLENHDKFKKVEFVRQNGENKNSKMLYLIKQLFPPYRLMTQRYAKLSSYPFLLPYYWVVRILTSGRKKRNLTRLNEVKDMNSHDMEKEILFFEKLGL